MNLILLFFKIVVMVWCIIWGCIGIFDAGKRSFLKTIYYKLTREKRYREYIATHKVMTISFEEFKKLYEANKEKWTLYSTINIIPDMTIFALNYAIPIGGWNDGVDFKKIFLETYTDMKLTKVYFDKITEAEKDNEFTLTKQKIKNAWDEDIKMKDGK